MLWCKKQRGNRCDTEQLCSVDVTLSIRSKGEIISVSQATNTASLCTCVLSPCISFLLLGKMSHSMLVFLTIPFLQYIQRGTFSVCASVYLCIFPTTSDSKYHNVAGFEGALTNLGVYRFMWTPLCWSGCILLDLKHHRVVVPLFAGGSWLSNLAKCRRDADKMQPCTSAPAVTMALLECPPPWNSMVPKASVGLSCVCLLIDHFSDRLSFLAKRSALSFWLDEMPGGRPTCWPIRRPQQHLEERRM